MSGLKQQPDDPSDGIRTCKGFDLPHQRNSVNCWCCPDTVQPCRACGVQWWNLDETIDQTADDRDSLPMMKTFAGQARPDCPVCHGMGLEGEYDKDAPSVICHR